MAVSTLPKSTEHGINMSYARWSNSSWYAFYNVNGKLSLWYDLENTIDWEYDELKDIMGQDPVKIPQFFSAVYKCTDAEANEAIKYINMFIEEYDPTVGVEYNKEVEAMLAKWSSMDEGGYQESTHEKQAEFAKKRNNS